MQTDTIIQTSYIIDIIFNLHRNKIFDCVFFHTSSVQQMKLAYESYYYRKLQINKCLQILSGILNNNCVISCENLSQIR